MSKYTLGIYRYSLKIEEFINKDYQFDMLSQFVKIGMISVQLLKIENKNFIDNKKKISQKN